MRTIIRDNYEPRPGDYHDRIVHDTVNNRIWLFDCDGVYLNVSRTWLKVVNELGENDENFVPSQALLTRLIEETRKDIAAEAEARQNADTGLTEAISSEAASREEADAKLQEQIDTLEASTDVKDVVGTYAELQAYPTATLGDNDIIKVLQDETHDGATTYYRWNKTAGTFTPIGELGPYYTKEETDALLDTKLTATSLKTVNGESLVGEGNIEIKGGGDLNARLSIIYYKNYSRVYEAGRPMECTIQSIDSNKLDAFIKENGVGYPQFRYEDVPEGGYAWVVDTNAGRVYIPQSEMKERTGIDVVLNSPDTTWAEFDLQEDWAVDKSEMVSEYALPLSSLTPLVNTGTNNLVGPLPLNEGDPYIPAKAIASIQVTSYWGTGIDHVPDNFAAYMPNLQYVSIYAKHIGDNLGYGSGVSGDGLNVSFNPISIGNSFLTTAKIKDIVMGFERLKSVGHSFMHYANCPNLTNISFPMLESTGDSFMAQVTTATGFQQSQQKFPMLSTVGHRFFLDTAIGKVDIPVLSSAGDGFFQVLNTHTQGNTSLYLLNVSALASLGSNAFNGRRISVSNMSFDSLTSIGPGFFRNAYIGLQGSAITLKFPKLSYIPDSNGDRGFMADMTTGASSFGYLEGLWLEFPAMGASVASVNSDRSFRSTKPTGNPLYDDSVAPYGGIKIISSTTAARSFHDYFQTIHTMGLNDSNSALVGLIPPESHELNADDIYVPRWFCGLPSGVYGLPDGANINGWSVYNLMIALRATTAFARNLPNFSGDWNNQIPYKTGRLVEFSPIGDIRYMAISPNGDYSSWKDIPSTN